MPYAFHVFSLCWNHLVHYLSHIVQKISLHVPNMACALRQPACCVTHFTDQVASEAVAGNYDVLPVPWLPALPSAVIFAVQLWPVEGRPRSVQCWPSESSAFDFMCGQNKFFSSLLFPDRLWGPPGFSFIGHQEHFPRGQREQILNLNAHLFVQPRFKVRGAVPPLTYSSLWRDA